MRIALCLIKRLGWWCEDMQSFKNYYLVGTIPLKDDPGKYNFYYSLFPGTWSLVRR